MLSACALAVGDMMDGIVVGQRMGVTGLAAVSLALPAFMVMNVIMHGLGLGGAVRFAEQMAQGKRDEAVRGFQGVLAAAVLLGAGLAALVNVFLTPLLALLGTTAADGALYGASRTYLRITLSGMPLFFAAYVTNYFLRNDDSERRASVGFTVGNGCDILLNVVFVLLLGQGVAGAAWATLAGQAAALCIYLPGLFGKGGSLRLLPLRPALRGVPACFRAGFASSSQYLFSMVFLLTANRFLLRSVGSAGVAVFDVVQNVSFLVTWLYDGTVKAAQPLLSTYSGERNLAGRRETVRMALRWGLAAGAAAALLIACFPGAVCLLFGLTEPAAAQLGRYALRVYALGALPAGVCLLLEGCYQACGEEKRAYLLTALRGAAVLLPVTFLFAALGGRLFWWLYPVTELLALAVFALWHRRFSPKETGDEAARVCTATIRSRNAELAGLLARLEAFCERWEATPQQSYFVQVAAEELCAAIMKQGFAGADGYLQVTVIAEETGGFSLHLRDNAAPFDPFSLRTARAGGAEAFDPDALGMLVVREKSKEFFYRRYQGFNTLTVRI